MRSRTLAIAGAAALLALSPFAISGVAYAQTPGVTGPTGSGSSEAETQGATRPGAQPRLHAPQATVPGPTGSASSEAEVQGSGPKTVTNPLGPHNSTGVVTHSDAAVGSSSATPR
jgi:hypothetical protein